MKKIMAFFAAVMSFLILCAAPCTFKANAGIGSTYTYEEVSDVHSSGLASNPNYIYFDWNTVINGTTFEGYCLMCFPDTSTFTFDDDILTISNYGEAVFYDKYFYSSTTSGTKEYATAEGVRFWYGSTASSNVTYNTNTQRFGGSGDIASALFKNGSRHETINVFNFQSNISVLNPVLDVDVFFSPDLSGDVDRSVDGVISEEFYIDISNHSRFGVQCLMAIVPHGGNIDFYDRNDSLQDKDVSGVVAPNSSNFKFLWWSDEVNYNFDSTIQTSSPHAHHPDFAETFVASKQISPCPWHYVGALQPNYRHYFSWTQIPLEKYNCYDVLVYAVRNDYGFASRQAAFPEGDYFIDYDEIQLVYNSTFTLQNGYVFNVNDTSNGNYVVDNAAQLTNLGLSSKGYFDDNNDVHIEGKSVNDFLETHQSLMSNWQEAYQRPVISGSSNSNSFDSVNSIISPFMRFINNTFSYFPSPIQTCFYIGFIAIVVLAILKKVMS